MMQRVFSATWRPLMGGLCTVAAVSWSTASDLVVCDESAPKLSPPPKKLRVGVLGATGAVGQRFLERLEDHPWFEVTHVGASSRSAGKSYADATHWFLSADVPRGVREHKVVTCDPVHFKDCDFVFSALDASVAGDVETAFAAAGFPVFSNARNHRMGADVPLVVPPVNSDHLDVVQHQKWYHRGGFIVTNANCSSTGLCIALKPLHDAFGIDKAMVFTMQAVSGAGYPGVSSLDAIDNLVPYIGGEEDKLETEHQKILGGVHATGPDYWNKLTFPISAHANRVPVRDGHTLCVSVKLQKPASVEDAAAVLATYVPADPAVCLLPSAPQHFVAVRAEKDRPQPRVDRDTGDGFTTVVGQIRPCPILDLKLTVVSHNTVMGAAGSSILNAELAVARGLLRRRS